MLKFIRPTDAIPARPIVVTIAGYPGLGKSSLAFTCHNPIVFDFEGSVSRVNADMRDYDTISVDRSNYEEWYAFVRGYSRMDGISFDEYVQSQGIKTVVIDTIGSMLERCVSPFIAMRDPKYAQKDGSLNQKGWGEMQRHAKELFLSFTERGLDVLILAHVKEESGAGDAKVLRLSIKGGTIEFVLADSDMLGFLKINARNQRVLDFNPSTEQLGKNTAGIKELVLPGLGEMKSKQFLKTRVFDEAKAAMSKMTDKQKKAASVIKDFESKIMASQTPEEINEIIPQLTTLDQVIKLQIETIAQRRFAALYCGDIQEAAALTALVSQIAEDTSLSDGNKAALKSRITAIADGLKLVFSKEAKSFIADASKN